MSTETPPAIISTAPGLYALTEGQHCEGPDNCHWCGDKCSRSLRHDGPPVIPHVRTDSTARCPANQYVCIGCWLFRRRRVTVHFLRDPKLFRDGQCPMSLSWLITPGKAVVIEPFDFPSLWPILLSPPSTFTLALLNKEKINLLQKASVNTFNPVRADSELKFSLDNVPLDYTVNELTSLLREPGDINGRSPGCRTLFELLGPYKIPEEPRKVGAPTIEQREQARPNRVIKKNGH